MDADDRDPLQSRGFDPTALSLKLADLYLRSENRPGPIGRIAFAVCESRIFICDWCGSLSKPQTLSLNHLRASSQVLNFVERVLRRKTITIQVQEQSVAMKAIRLFPIHEKGGFVPARSP